MCLGNIHPYKVSGIFHMFNRKLHHPTFPKIIDEKQSKASSEDEKQSQFYYIFVTSSYAKT